MKLVPMAHVSDEAFMAAIRRPDTLEWWRKAMTIRAAWNLSYPWEDEVENYYEQQSEHNQKWDRLRAWRDATKAQAIVTC